MNLFAPPEGPLSPQNLWTAWNLELSILIALGLSIAIYAAGTVNIWRNAGTGHGIRFWHWIRFLGAILGVVAALLSPLDALSEALFSAHMVQHLILILIVAPLLVMSEFPLAFMWTLPRAWAQGLGHRLNRYQLLSRGWRVFSSPAMAWTFFLFTLWTWHAPKFFEAGLKNEAIHTVEHLGLLISSMLFWWVLLKPTRQKHLHYGVAIPYLFTTILHSSILGALMSFTSRPWYAYYAASSLAWGLTPLQDQQLAGLIMWIPGGFVFTLLTIGFFAAWLRALEQRKQPVRHDLSQTR